MSMTKDHSQLARAIMDIRHVDDGGITFTQDLVSLLRSAGFEIWRMSFTLNTMHPEVLWRTLMWQEETGPKIVDRPHNQISQSIYQLSPIPALRAGGPPLYIFFDRSPLPYPICDDLQKGGGTAYFAFGLPYSFGEMGYISFSTKNPKGISESDQKTLIELTPFLARRIELQSSYHLNQCLLQVYLGRNAAKRVIEGNFKRGQSELIPAAIWFCDLRGFTELSARTEPQSLVQKLDVYFEIVTDAITQNGGDVLKFIGDAVLAVFPLDSAPKKSCQSALVAAEKSLAALKDHSDLKIGIALHVGDVLYGNIGGRDRLDFTVISSAVNEASRLEGLCKDLGSQLVLSEAFVKLGDVKNYEDLGSHQLKGVKTPLRVFGHR